MHTRGSFVNVIILLVELELCKVTKGGTGIPYDTLGPNARFKDLILWGRQVCGRHARLHESAIIFSFIDDLVLPV